jgi:hypothetical protein
MAVGVPGRLRHYKGGRSSSKPQEKSLVLIFRGGVDLRAHGFVGRNHGKKSPVTPPGIDPGTVRLVAQRLNATPGPHKNLYQDKL